VIYSRRRVDLRWKSKYFQGLEGLKCGKLVLFVLGPCMGVRKQDLFTQGVLRFR
jgi:hypothetical protein